ncbi:alpha/beta hydrolase fold domain-containing protein [Chryseobacterium sp. FH2]|uniref:alpha/beta hydrolase fold domain-containing protein n=1 Tax=Chryseobacterium sp. FH2 TaxID=1674291 RepID=UPI00065AD056|nr:alpha/beta hydrolase fold domain-containing protein [Chryseobacterium sp. FH2]
MKKHIITIGIAATLFLGGCASHIKISKEQAATMSQQAVDTLKSFKYLKLPIIKATDKMRLMGREQFAAYEKWQIADMHKRFDFTVTDTIIENVKVNIIKPKNIKPENQNVIGFHIHGGAFFLGSGYERAALLMANEYGYTIYSVDYTLAPEAKYPVAINECLKVYKYLVTNFPAKNIVSSSLSAGGPLMMSALLKAQNENLKMPIANVVLSPALELAIKGDTYISNDRRDVIAGKNSINKLALPAYLDKDTDLNDPFVSPVNADYKGNFPASIITTATRDLFLSNSSRLLWKLKSGGIAAELLVGEGMWHGYQTYPDIPESIEARKAIYDFLNRQLKTGTMQTETQINTEANKAVVLRFVNEVINNKHFELIDELWSPTMVWHGGSAGEVYGIENYKKMLIGAADASFSNMLLQVKDIIVSDDKVVLYFSNSGKNIGDFMGNKATNKTAIWNGMGIYRIENGKIAEAWFSEDHLAMFQQLGFIK